MNQVSLSDLDIQIEYTITTQLGLIYESRYNQEINAKIYHTDDKGDNMVLIGTMKGYKLLLSEAVNSSVSAFDVFDVFEETSQYTKIFDFKKGEFKSKVFEDTFDFNLLILARIEILPEFRGLEISKFALKDFMVNFGSGCGLIVGKPYPLQFEGGIERNVEKPQYKGFSTNEKQAKAKLLSLYSSIGFSLDYGGLITFSPETVNENFKSIDLDELTIKTT